MNISQLSRPIRIGWVTNSNLHKVDEIIVSKSTKKFLKQVSDLYLLDEHNLRYFEQSLDFKLYLEWLSLYESLFHKKGYKIIANDGWYKSHASLDLYIIGYRKNEVLTAGSIISINNQTGKITHHFKCSTSTKLLNLKNSSLGSLLEMKFLSFALRNNAKIISSGLSRNLFGVENSVGYLEFKLKFGYRPIIYPKYGFSSDFDQNNDSYYFFATTNESKDIALKLFFLRTQNKITNSSLEIIKKYHDVIELEY